MTKPAVVIISAIYGLTYNPSAAYFLSDHQETGSAVVRNVFQDTLPPLHTLKEEEIDSLTPSFADQTLTVVLKNGSTYTYLHKDWDFENYYPSTPRKIADAITHMEMTFTRVEHPPEFPGGEKAWDKYIRDFCDQHRDLIKKKGPADVMVQFTVHLKGQLVHVGVVSNTGDKQLSALAMQAIQDGPAWIPAIQNGRTVVCYKLQLIKLSL
jgi:hypothetical protein